jgi:uncharacterized protein (TIGR02421 family)
VSAHPGVSDQQLEEIVARVAAGKRVRRTLEGGMQLHLDRPLPFLVLYRSRTEPDDSDLRRLVTSGASWLIAPADCHAEASGLIAAVARPVGEQFGAYLLMELWEATGGSRTEEPGRGVRRPAFRVHCETLATDDPTVRQLVRALGDIPLRPRSLEVEAESGAAAHPPALPPIHAAATGGYRLHRLGIAVQPPYRQRGTGITYPVVYRVLRRGLTHALRQTAYHFAVTHTSHAPPHAQALGPRRTSSAVRQADATLSGIAASFDFLLQITPVNLDRAWDEFSRHGGARAPAFDYRPLVVDAAMLKRTLYSVRTEEIEDPTLAHLLDDTRDELDRKVTMLTDRGTPRFLYGSLAVYGPVDEPLLALAEALLGRLPPGDDSSGEPVDAKGVRRLAEDELAWYRARDPELSAKVHIRGDVSGLMVSQGDLLIGAGVSVSPVRARALVQHEVGTHVVTYHNGRSQPLKLMASGLAGYEELQEGLAVVSEWMVSGLTPARVRLLAGRVFAAHRVSAGATFVESWRELQDRGFSPRTAFTICARVYRSGGLTKDAIYLRGLVRLLRHFGNGGALEPMLAGKVAFEHLAFVEELRWRSVLQAPRLLPRCFSDDAAPPLLARLREGLSVMDLLDGEGE